MIRVTHRNVPSSAGGKLLKMGVSMLMMMSASIVIPQEQDRLWEPAVNEDYKNLSYLLSKPNQWSEEQGKFLASPESWNENFTEFINNPQLWHTDLSSLGSWENVERPRRWWISGDTWSESIEKPKLWIYGCGPVYGATEKDQENLAKLCELTGDGTSVLSAHAVESDLRIRLDPEVAETLMSHGASVFERQIAESLMHEYIDEWQHITGKRLVDIYFFEGDESVPFMEGRSTWFKGDRVIEADDPSEPET